LKPPNRSFDLFLENVLDPAHVDFAHDGVAGAALTGV
jgi:phenylpropionate dioxygenase-like ring-hydroxylating dioxygenase large terminal subunit